MTLALVFILIALGSVQAQVLVSPKSVTLQWLRLGDLISLPLLTLAVVIVMRAPGMDSAIGFTTGLVAGFLALGVVTHITLIHLGRRGAQRILNIFVLTVLALFLLGGPFLSLSSLSFPIGVDNHTPTDPTVVMRRWDVLAISFSQIISAFLLGGSIMTMMLGHAYLTAGGSMTQQPFLRLTRCLMIAIPIRALIAVLAGAWPYYQQYQAGAFENAPLIWPIMLMAARFGVGLVVPLVMAWMAYQCVRIRSNQSATGILYVTGLMLLIGELTALALWAETSLAF